jgi:hypothetical protein
MHSPHNPCHNATPEAISIFSLFCIRKATLKLKKCSQKLPDQIVLCGMNQVCLVTNKITRKSTAFNRERLNFKMEKPTF